MVKLADGQTSIGERKPGDTMVFTLNSTVPSDLLRMNTAGVMELVNPYTLVFHDKMNEKLESDYKDLKVTIDTMVLDPADYTVATARPFRRRDPERHAGLSGALQRRENHKG